MAMDNRIRNMGRSLDWCLPEYDDDSAGRNYTSPKSPTNLRYARSHAELAGRKDPPLTEGVSFTEKLDTDDGCFD